MHNFSFENLMRQFFIFIILWITNEVQSIASEKQKMLHTIVLNFVNFEDVAFLASTPQVSFIYVIQTTFQNFDIFYYIIFKKNLIYIDLIGVVEPCSACTG